MKFRFCGDQDCPDWFLTQMGTLSRLSSVKAKLLAQHVSRHLTGQEMQVDLVLEYNGMTKFTAAKVIDNS